MRVVSLGGAGAMGRATTRTLAADPAVDELVVADADEAAARSLVEALPGRAETAAPDATDPASLAAALEGADVVANALPYAFNLDVMAACLEVGAGYLDLGGLFHATLDQLELDDAFAEAGLSAVLGMGASPGLTNVATARGASRLDRVREVHIRTGAAGGAEGFAYSAKTILDELTMAPVVYRDGERRTLEPLAGRERYVLPEPVGEVEGFHSIHSELATMPETLPGVESVDFRVAFSPALLARTDVLRELGLTDETPVEVKGVEITPREFLDAHLARQPAPEPAEEWKSFRVDVLGERDGDAAHYRYTTVVASRLDDGGLSATAVWTGVPLGVAAVAAGRGEAAAGVNPPETAFDPGPMLDALADRGIVVDEQRVE